MPPLFPSVAPGGAVLAPSSRQPVASVVVMGPPMDRIGGMVSVTREHLRAVPGDRFRLTFVPMTMSHNEDESTLRRIARHLQHSLRLVSTIRAECTAIVHFHTCSGATFYRTAADMWLSRRLGSRVVLHIHGAGFDEFADSAGWFSRRLVRRCLSLADRVVALSGEWRRRLHRIAPDARITVIENAVAAIPTVRRVPGSNSCRFLLLARMDVWKGVDDLLDACVLLRDRNSAILLTLAGPPGSSGDAEGLRAKIADRDLGIFVEYVGPVDGEGKKRLLAQTDVLVVPSHQEGMPMAMLEALADGIPVVATRVGGMPDVITDGREGLLVPPRRPDLLAEAMHVIAGDAECRARMSAEALALALSRFGIDRFQRDLMRLYDGLMSERRSEQDSTNPTPIAVQSGAMATSTTTA